MSSIYKIELNNPSKWVPTPIYIGRTINPTQRFSQHKTFIRHTIALLEGNNNEYSINSKIHNAFYSFKSGIFRVRAGGMFKMGVILYMQGVRSKDIKRNDILNYINIDIIAKGEKVDSKGVNIDEYKKIKQYESSRYGFNGVASYQFETKESLEDVEVNNINDVLVGEDLKKNSIWWNGFSLATLLNQIDHDWYSPINCFTTWEIFKDVFDENFESLANKLFNKLKNDMEEFVDEINSKEIEFKDMVRDIKIKIKELKVIDKNYSKNEEIFKETRKKIIDLQGKYDVFEDEYKDLKNEIMVNHHKKIK